MRKTLFLFAICCVYALSRLETVRGQDATPPGTVCAMEATVYEVRLPVEKVSRIDFNTLSASAKDATTFEKKLAELGTAKPLYHANQPVALAGDMVSLVTEEPFANSSTSAARGATRGAATTSAPATRGAESAPAAPTARAPAAPPPAAESIIYRKVGPVFTVIGDVVGKDRLNVDVKVYLTAITEGTVSLSSGAKAGIIRTTTMVHKGLVDADKPFVILQADGGTPDANGNAVAYVVRMSLGAPKVQ